MLIYHVTTGKKAKMYRATGYIKSPVRGFNTLMAAMAWAIQTGRIVIYQFEADNPHKLPDHHNEWGEAYWNDGDVKDFKCVLGSKKPIPAS